MISNVCLLNCAYCENVVYFMTSVNVLRVSGVCEIVNSHRLSFGCCVGIVDSNPLGRLQPPGGACGIAATIPHALISSFCINIQTRGQHLANESRALVCRLVT